MKKYIGILTFTVVALLSSCSNQLDRFPVDSLVEETAYNSVNDLKFGLAGAIGNYDFNPVITFNSIFTDNTRLGRDNGGQLTGLHQQILNAEGGDQGLWNSRYSVINNFNRLLTAAATITPSSADQDAYNNILAQCYAFRAFAHYELLLYYGFDFMDDASLGVPYVDYVSTDATPARNTTGEVLVAIQADLDQALALFPAGTSDINFATPDFVTFLRARIALESGDNSAVIPLCTSLIAKYPLANQLQYFNMFNEDADVTEVVYKYDNVQGFDYGINFIWNFSGQGPKFEISHSLFDLIQDDDIRKAVILDPASDVADDLLIVGKYPINADTQAINDFKAMRISEIYLIRAEAYAKSGQLGLAAADVLAVQTARHSAAPSPISYGNLLEAINGIIAEKRIELAYEGHRYTDIKRVKSITNQGIERGSFPGDCGGAYPCSLPVSSPKFIFPIPTGELNANPVISDQQAPGY
ncbi:MAG: RagB/SusD family nutrient uptake outer membrane protein [Aquaticitalea sp.]